MSLHVSEQLRPDVLERLRLAFDPLDGEVEAPPDLRFAVITVPVSAGFSAIEAAVTTALAPTGTGWAFGNVYGDDNAPLNWWL